MSKLTKQQEEDINEINEMYDGAPDADDYCFVIGPDGKIKSIILPDVIPFKAPKTVERILKIFGIRDIQDIDDEETLH
jgi:hypothetical protein